MKESQEPDSMAHILPASIDLSLIRNHMQPRGFLDMIQVLHFVIEFERH